MVVDFKFDGFFLFLNPAWSTLTSVLASFRCPRVDDICSLQPVSIEGDISVKSINLFGKS